MKGQFTLNSVFCISLLLAPSLSAQSADPPQATREPDHNAATHVDHFERRFDNAAEWVSNFDDPARDNWQMPARVIDTLHIQAGQLVADIGAGTGYFTVRLAGSAAQPTVFAVDIEPSMVEHVRDRATTEGLTNVTSILAAADDPHLPESVDLALLVNTYHHIPNRVEYFTKLRGMLKPGGRVAIIDFRKDSPSGPPVEFRLTSDEIRNELEAANFSLQASYAFLPRQLFLVFGSK
jgi:ubiquinone/menaquinone biosynthesis C-methylase UbiE